MNEESFSFGGVSFKAYDIGGQEVRLWNARNVQSFRLLWKRFLGEVDASIQLYLPIIASLVPGGCFRPWAIWRGEDCNTVLEVHHAIGIGVLGGDERNSEAADWVALQQVRYACKCEECTHEHRINTPFNPFWTKSEEKQYSKRMSYRRYWLAWLLIGRCFKPPLFDLSPSLQYWSGYLLSCNIVVMSCFVVWWAKKSVSSKTTFKYILIPCSSPFS